MSPSANNNQWVGTFTQEHESRRRFRRKVKEERNGLSDELYRKIKDKLLNGQLPPTVAAVKRETRGTNRAYLAIDRLQREGIVRQAENGRYQLAN